MPSRTFDKPPIRSAQTRMAEVAFFAPICDDDFAYLGVPDDTLKSTFAHASNVLLTADKLGFNNILCPSSYQVGQDTLTFAAAVAPMTEQISLLTAVRCGEMNPAMLGRTVATLDHILRGRLTLNIISSDQPGEKLDSATRYRKSEEVIQILQQGWTQERIQFSGKFYQFDLPAAPMQPYQQNGGPLLYFGGMSEEGRALCAKYCDVFLMWPETEARLLSNMQDLSARAAQHKRVIDFGLRIHIIVRDTEREARDRARELISKLDDQVGAEIRNRALDATSLGVQRQASMRDSANDEGYAEPLLWTDIGRARSGCGCALVGTPEQIVEKLERYISMGFRSFIFSGYPQKNECELIGKLILPHLQTGSMARLQGRIPEVEPMTPLGRGARV